MTAAHPQTNLPCLSVIQYCGHLFSLSMDIGVGVGFAERVELSYAWAAHPQSTFPSVVRMQKRGQTLFVARLPTALALSVSHPHFFWPSEMMQISQTGWIRGSALRFESIA